MNHPHHLLRNRAGTTGGITLYPSVPQRAAPRDPIDAAVLIKPLILRQDKGILQQLWHLMQGDSITGIPAVLIGKGQGLAMAIQNLDGVGIGSNAVKITIGRRIIDRRFADKNQQQDEQTARAPAKGFSHVGHALRLPAIDIQSVHHPLAIHIGVIHFNGIGGHDHKAARRNRLRGVGQMVIAGI